MVLVCEAIKLKPDPKKNPYEPAQEITAEVVASVVGTGNQEVLPNPKRDPVTGGSNDGDPVGYPDTLTGVGNSTPNPDDYLKNTANPAVTRKENNGSSTTNKNEEDVIVRQSPSSIVPGKKPQHLQKFVDAIDALNGQKNPDFMIEQQNANIQPIEPIKYMQHVLDILGNTENY
jgi:hypothetical protein